MTDIADRLERKKGFGVETKDTTLRDLFVEGVSDSTLRWELTKKVEAATTTTFADVREVADQWTLLSGDTKKSNIRAAVNVVEQADHNLEMMETLV